MMTTMSTCEAYMYIYIDHTLIILSSLPYMHNYVWSDNWYWGTGIQNNVDRKHTQGLVMYMYMYVQAPMSIV